MNQDRLQTLTPTLKQCIPQPAALPPLANSRLQVAACGMRCSLFGGQLKLFIRFTPNHSDT